MFELLMERSNYLPDDDVAVELRGDPNPDGVIAVSHLGHEVQRFPANTPLIELGKWRPGGYGLTWESEGVRRATAAFRVEPFPGARLFYGFVSEYPEQPDLSGMTELARRLHLNAVQFYDWAFRHADLLGGGEKYTDPLGRPVHLESVASMIDAFAEIGAVAHGYAAVYAVGDQEWEDWSPLALLDAEGNAYALADFLRIIDCSDPRWLSHFTQELKSSSKRPGFVAFHLDQYGQPKWGQRADGALVDVEKAFSTLVRHIADQLPDARLVFNNVNDFPSWSSTSWPQSAVYIEPWAPNDDLGSLASMITAARNRGSLPVCLAAYQSVYRTATRQEADLAAQFTMATCFSHGATQLLAGQSHSILVDPYYVDHHDASPSTVSMLAEWYDFAAEWDELLFDPEINDITQSHAGTYNDDIDVEFGKAQITSSPQPGALWRRITRTSVGDVVHVVNLIGQKDTLWDAPKSHPQNIGPGRLRIRCRRAGQLPEVQVLSPGAIPVKLNVEDHGTHAEATLPSPSIWQVIHIVDK